MISYSQNHEDVVLARGFPHREYGFYIDVGAEHPVVNSVTKHFYDRGWRGINIEPSHRFIALLSEARPEDINLRTGIAEVDGKATFFEGPEENHGASSFCADVVEQYRRVGQTFTEVRDVPVTTLAAVFDEYVGDRIVDFLKIDVEGSEAAVVAGADWRRWRPRVVVIEATHPNSRLPSHDVWEPDLLAADYRLALFDGLNRFYVSADEPLLLDALSSPACVFDDFVEAGQLQRVTELETEIVAQAGELEAYRARLVRADEESRILAAREEEIVGYERELRRLRRDRRGDADRLAEAEEEVLRRELAAGALRDRLTAETTARRAAEQDAAEQVVARQQIELGLAALQATKTFRWTAGLRKLYGLARRLRD
jgi:FkbM family methyltransferase